MSALPHAQAVVICNRAWRIVDRVMPASGPAPHGWYDTPGFIAHCQHRDRRNRLYKAVFARLAAKAEAIEQFVEAEQFTEVHGDPMLKRRA